MGRRERRHDDLSGFGAWTNSGEWLGRVDTVIEVDALRQPLYLVVDTWSWFHMGRRSVVPFGEVDRIDAESQRVYCKGLTKEVLESDVYPRYSERWWDKSVSQRFSVEELAAARRYRDAALAPAIHHR